MPDAPVHGLSVADLQLVAGRGSLSGYGSHIEGPGKVSRPRSNARLGHVRGLPPGRLEIQGDRGAMPRVGKSFPSPAVPRLFVLLPRGHRSPRNSSSRSVDARRSTVCLCAAAAGTSSKKRPRGRASPWLLGRSARLLNDNVCQAGERRRRRQTSARAVCRPRPRHSPGTLPGRVVPIRPLAPQQVADARPFRRYIASKVSRRAQVEVPVVRLLKLVETQPPPAHLRERRADHPVPLRPFEAKRPRGRCGSEGVVDPAAPSHRFTHR